MLEDRLARAHLAARAAWASAGGAHAPPRALLGLRFTPRSNDVEIYATVTDREPGGGIVFFAGAHPAQVYACAAFKCVPRQVTSSALGVSVPHYQIVDSEEDLKLANKSPLRAIGCNIALQNTGVDSRRLFAAEVVAPAAADAFYAAAP